jgi:hypothetical protein
MSHEAVPTWTAAAMAMAVAMAFAPLLAACVPRVAQAPSPAPAPVQPELPVTTTLRTTIDAALDAAARQTGMRRAALVVASAEAITWSDGSLGCPQPGTMYTQALVPGYRVVIRAGSGVLEYHASRRGLPFLCPSARVVDPVRRDSM